MESLWPCGEVAHSAGLLIHGTLKSHISAGLLIHSLLGALFWVSHASSLLCNINRNDVTTWNAFCITVPLSEKSNGDHYKWRVGRRVNSFGHNDTIWRIDVSQHWFIALWDQTISCITWANIDLSLNVICDIHQDAISQVPMTSIRNSCNMWSEITPLQ